MWIEFLVDFEWNYVSFCASISFIRNCDIESPLEVRVIDQRELSFFTSFTFRGSWMLIVSTKKSKLEDTSQSRLV